MSLREDILKKSGLLEMAMSDLEGIDLKKASAKEVASSYIQAAKKRGMDDKKIIAGLGSTFRGVGDLDSNKRIKMVANIDDVKEAIKKELGFESKKAASKKKKEEKAEEPVNTEEKTKEPVESFKDRILKNSGVINEMKMYSMSTGYGKMYSKDGDKYYSNSGKKMYCKSTDKMYTMGTDGKMHAMTKAGEGKKAYSKATEKQQYTCKYCGEKFDSKEKLNKHMKMCGV